MEVFVPYKKCVRATSFPSQLQQKGFPLPFDNGKPEYQYCLPIYTEPYITVMGFSRLQAIAEEQLPHTIRHLMDSVQYHTHSTREFD